MKRIFGTVALIQHTHTWKSVGKFVIFRKISHVFGKHLDALLLMIIGRFQADARASGDWQKRFNDYNTAYLLLLYRPHATDSVTQIPTIPFLSLIHISLPMRFSSEILPAKKTVQIKKWGSARVWTGIQQRNYNHFNNNCNCGADIKTVTVTATTIRKIVNKWMKKNTV